MRDPKYLINSKEFKSTGAILWPDYWHQSKSNPVFDILNITCSHTHYQQESGQLLIHRERHWKPLQLSYYMNEQTDLYYRLFLGDKETFYLSWKALNASYHFIRRWLSTVGFLNPDGKILDSYSKICCRCR